MNNINNLYGHWTKKGSYFNLMIDCGYLYNQWVQTALEYLPSTVLDENKEKLLFLSTAEFDACRVARQYCEAREIILLSERILPKEGATGEHPEVRYFIFAILHEVAHAIKKHKSKKFDKLTDQENIDQEDAADAIALDWFNEHVKELNNENIKPISIEEIRRMREKNQILMEDLHKGHLNKEPISINMEDLMSIKDSLINTIKEISQDKSDVSNKLKGVCSEIDKVFMNDDDYSWPMSIRDFCNNFDINYRTALTHRSKYLKEEDDCYFYGSGMFRELYFTKLGALKIFMHSKSEKGIRYLRKHGIANFPKEEHLYMKIIENAINRFDIAKKEFKVPILGEKYKKIDLYLQNAKLAIECDEHDHYWQEDFNDYQKREEDINKELGCRFLRFNPHEPNFNLGEIINIIFHHILGKSINGKDPINFYMEKKESSVRKRNHYKLSEVDLADFD